MTPAWRRGLLRDGDAPPRSGPLVVKLGGSLLGRPAWARDVTALLDAVPAPRLLVVGGGPIVDGLRKIDAAAPQPADVMHRLAINCMGLTARLVAATLVHPLVAECGSGCPSTAVLDVPAWLDHDGRYDQLPVGWHVSSDSIAACVAATCGGDLLLVKSVAPPSDDIEQLAEAGWVDSHFPAAARKLTRIAWAASG